MFKKLSIITLASLVIPVSILAQTASPSGNPIRDAVKEKVAAELDQIKKAVTKKAYVGSITAKTDTGITLTNLKNQLRTITIPADSTIKLTGGKEGTPADLKVGDFLIVMGDADGAGVLTAKRILVIAKPSDDDKRVIATGTVTKVSSASITLTDTKGQTITTKINSSTKYTKTTKFADIETNSKITIITSPSTALLIHLLP